MEDVNVSPKKLLSITDYFKRKITPVAENAFDNKFGNQEICSQPQVQIENENPAENENFINNDSIFYGNKILNDFKNDKSNKGPFINFLIQYIGF